MIAEQKLIDKYDEAIRNGIGAGRFERYQPFLTTSQVKSRAVKSRVPSLRYRRTFHFLSFGELAQFLRLEFDPDVIEVREQYPLDPRNTLKIAQELNVLHPGYSKDGVVMTTDFLITVRGDDGILNYRAIQIKHTDEEIDEPRTNAKLAIEQEYWKMLGIPWTVTVSSAFIKVFTRNLQLLFQLRNRELPESDKLREVLHEVLYLRERMPEHVFEELADFPLPCGMMAGFAVKMLCACRLLNFPMREKMLWHCRMCEFEPGGELC